MKRLAHFRRATLVVGALALGPSVSAAALPAAAETASEPPQTTAPLDQPTPGAEEPTSPADEPAKPEVPATPEEGAVSSPEPEAPGTVPTPPAEPKPAPAEPIAQKPAPAGPIAPNSIVVPDTEMLTPGEEKETGYRVVGTGTLVIDAPTGAKLRVIGNTGCDLNATATQAFCGTDASTWSGDYTLLWVTGLADTVYGQYDNGRISLQVGSTVTESSPWSVNLIPNAPATDVATAWDQSAPGYVVTGSADSNATITVEGASGNVITTGTAGSDGAFRIPVNTTPNTLLVTFQTKDGVISGDYGLARTGALPTPVTQTPSGRVPSATAITGLGFPGATVAVTDTTTSDSLGSTTVRADGTWTLPITAGLTPGEHTFSSAQTFGTTTTTATPLTATVVAAPDAPVVTSPADGTTVDAGTSTITIAGTATAGNDITVRDGTGETVSTTHASADGSFECEVTGLSDGSNTWSVTQTDEFDRASSAATASVFRTASVNPVVDPTTPPVAPTSAPIAPTHSAAATTGTAPEVLAYTGSDGAWIAGVIVASLAALTTGLLLMLPRHRTTRSS